MKKAKTVNPMPMWWSGDPRVEPFMREVDKALDRSGKKLENNERTDIYNRAYEAVYAAIEKYDRKKFVGEL